MRKLTDIERDLEEALINMRKACEEQPHLKASAAMVEQRKRVEEFQTELREHLDHTWKLQTDIRQHLDSALEIFAEIKRLDS